MSSSAIVGALSKALLNCVPLAASIRLKREAKSRDKEREWQDRQAARFESLKQRMQAEEEFATLRYTDLPHVRLAGLLAAPNDERVERR
jgi:hypothetical protein